MSLTFVQVRQAFRDQALTVSGWAESPIPYALFSVDATPDQPAAPSSDSQFAVGLMAIRDSNEFRSRGKPGVEGALMEADVGVRLLNRIVPNARVDSVDTALAGIQAVYQALMAQGASYPGGMGVLFVGEIVPQANASGEWLVTDLRFRARWPFVLV